MAMIVSISPVIAIMMIMPIIMIIVIITQVSAAVNHQIACRAPSSSDGAPSSAQDHP